MNVIFNKCIFAYLCIFFFIVQQSISMNLKVFLLILALPIFLSKYPPIFTDIFYISVKSKYRYIRNYRYFIPWLYPWLIMKESNFLYHYLGALLESHTSSSLTCKQDFVFL